MLNQVCGLGPVSSDFGSLSVTLPQALPPACTSGRSHGASWEIGFLFLCVTGGGLLYFHEATLYHTWLYYITYILGYVPPYLKKKKKKT